MKTEGKGQQKRGELKELRREVIKKR